MHFARLMAMAFVALMVVACGSPEPAREPVREESAAATAAADLQRKHNEEAAQLEKRAADLERRWTEMTAKVKEKSATPTAGLRAEVQEDITSLRDAVADLKTTTVDNWGNATSERWSELPRCRGRRTAVCEDQTAPAQPETVAMPARLNRDGINSSPGCERESTRGGTK